ncbi:hypothetical protein [Streptomyces sp. NRRL S-237]|uniref:hypothetical protein n=1 Tax=Streptomyces sp. NRRL S-237 TaxID=1463895 RepID=UPI0004CAAEB8|nr:hypothetical protein [Streptomyces sp. NRRL S-237]
MRDTDPGRHAVARETEGEDQDPLLDELRTAVGRPPRALVAAIASWPAPRGRTAPGPDEPADTGRADAGIRFTPRSRTAR